MLKNLIAVVVLVAVIALASRREDDQYRVDGYALGTPENRVSSTHSFTGPEFQNGRLSCISGDSLTRGTRILVGPKMKEDVVRQNLVSDGWTEQSHVERFGYFGPSLIYSYSRPSGPQVQVKFWAPKGQGQYPEVTLKP